MKEKFICTRDMWTGKFLCCLFLSIFLDVQAKALHQSKIVTFQEFKEQSAIPYWYPISDSETAFAIKNDFTTPVIHEVSTKIQNAKLPPSFSTSDNLEDVLERKFDLTNHESLEEVIDLENSNLIGFQELKNKESSISHDETRKKSQPALSKLNSDYFTVDQVFENKPQNSPVHSKGSSTKPIGTHALHIDRKKLDIPTKRSGETCTSQTLTVQKNLFPIADPPDSNELKLRSKREAIASKLQDVTGTQHLNENAKDSENYVEGLHNEQIWGKLQTNFPSENLESNSNNLKTSVSDKTSSGLDLSKFNDQVTNLRQLGEEKSDSVDANAVGELLNNDVRNLFNNSLRSFVFNPQAQPLEKFQSCQTRKNESGHCRYVQHCMLPSLLGSVQQFMENVCIIRELFIGVCCPEFPVSTLKVRWPNKFDNSSAEESPVKTFKDCGVGTNTRIVGGTDADRKAWPWMVALLNNQKKFFCGGSLINNRYVLTASHCTFGPTRDQIIARLGEHDFNDTSKPHEDYLVTEIKRHGQYTRVTLRNDIALLKLERPVELNEFVKTICLPKMGEEYVGKTAFLAGWGHTNGGTRPSNILQEVSFPIINNTECAKTHGLSIPPSVICAAAIKKDKGACNGDSGGPLMVLDDERWKVIGVVSWGRRGCNTRFPTVYTRVTFYLDWIQKHAI